MINSQKLLNTSQSTDTKSAQPTQSFFAKANVKLVSIKNILAGTLAVEKTKLQQKKARELQERREKTEERLETKPGAEKDRGLTNRIPRVGGMGVLGWFKNFIGSILLGFLLTKLLGARSFLEGFLKTMNNVSSFLANFGMALVNGFATFVNAGYEAYDATKGFLKDLGGEDLEKLFEGFMDKVSMLVDALIIASLIKGSGDFGPGRRRRRRGPDFPDPRGPRGPRGPRPKPPKPKRPTGERKPKTKPQGRRPRFDLSRLVQLAAAVGGAVGLGILTRGKGRALLNLLSRAGVRVPAKTLEKTVEQSVRRKNRGRRVNINLQDILGKNPRRIQKQERVKLKEEALAGGGSGARGDSGSPSDPKRPKYGRGVNPAEMRPEVGDEMFEQGKKANDAYKMITGKEPPKKSKGNTKTGPSPSKPGRMPKARNVIQPFDNLLDDNKLTNRILTDKGFRKKFEEFLMKKFKLRNPLGGITDGITLDEYAALSGTTTDQLIKSELAQKGPKSFKATLKLTEQQVVPLRPQVKVSKTKEGLIKAKPPTREMLQRATPPSPKGIFRAARGALRKVPLKIPILFGLLDFGLAFLAGEPLGRAAFSAIGAGLVGIVASVIGSGLPFIGNIILGAIGGTAGAMMGEALYDFLFTGQTPTVRNEALSEEEREMLSGGVDPDSLPKAAKTPNPSFDPSLHGTPPDGIPYADDPSQQPGLGEDVPFEDNLQSFNFNRGKDLLAAYNNLRNFTSYENPLGTNTFIISRNEITSSSPPSLSMPSGGSPNEVALIDPGRSLMYKLS